MRELINLIENASITFKIVSREFHHGQHDLTLEAIIGNHLAGIIDFSDYHGSVEIQMIKVENAYRRRGIATAMLRELQKQYPDIEIKLGMLTDDGSKFISSIPYKEIPNGDLPKIAQRLEALRKKLDSYNEYYEKTGIVPKDWNDLHDEERKLEDRLRGHPITKRVIDLD